MQEPNNILVIIVARIGDTLLATPTIRSLHEHYPAARITVLAHPGRKTVLENLPFIDELGKITKKMAPFKGYLGGKPYDLCIVYSKDTALLAYARRVSKKVITFKHDQHKSLPDLEFVTPPSEATHAVIERLMLLAPLNIETQNLRVAYQITEQEKTWARQWIQEAFGHTPDTLIGIQAMSFPTKPYRNWPLNHFSSLIERLAVQHKDTAFILLGDHECRDKTQSLTQAPGHAIVNSCGNLTLRESAALMGQLDLYIGVDTGPTHIVGALETPMVAIYHCYHPGALLMPLQRENLEVIEHSAYASECSRETPISDVPVEAVFSACERQLNKASL